MNRVGWIALVLATAVTFGCNRADRADANRTPGSGAVGTAGDADVSMGDRDFVRDVAIANMAEVDLGRLAASRATDPEVKKFAQLMIDDHTAAGDKLKSVVSTHNISIPTDLDDKHRDLHEKLSKLQGPEFDREYMEEMVDGHENVVDKLGSRIDQPKLAEWKAETEDRASGKKVEQHAETRALVPEPSDDRITTAINTFAAEAYPTVYAHLQAAKALSKAVNKRTTD